MIKSKWSSNPLLGQEYEKLVTQYRDQEKQEYPLYYNDNSRKQELDTIAKQRAKQKLESTDTFVKDFGLQGYFTMKPELGLSSFRIEIVMNLFRVDNTTVPKIIVAPIRNIINDKNTKLNTILKNLRSINSTHQQTTKSNSADANPIRAKSIR